MQTLKTITVYPNDIIMHLASILQGTLQYIVTSIVHVKHSCLQTRMTSHYGACRSIKIPACACDVVLLLLKFDCP